MPQVVESLQYCQKKLSQIHNDILNKTTHCNFCNKILKAIFSVIVNIITHNYI
jgi:hypothetical protein